MIARRVMLARAWRISPAQLRDCTQEEVNAMFDILSLEAEARG